MQAGTAEVYDVTHGTPTRAPPGTTTAMPEPCTATPFTGSSDSPRRLQSGQTPAEMSPPHAESETV